MITEWIQKRKIKMKLENSFRVGQIYLTHKSKNHTHYILPKIHDISPSDGRIQCVFTVPVGLDPKEILKREWLFKQQFGEHITLTQKNKKFVLTIYGHGLAQEIPYVFDDLQKHIEGLRVPIVIGKNRNNEMLCYDMMKHPHLLVAGETGSGKSCQLRVILSTLIQYKTPEELELYLGDPKHVEFFLFDNIPMVKKVANEPHEIAAMVQQVVIKLKERKRLLKEAKVPHIDKYNMKTKKKLPYILLCIDEFAELQGEGDLKKDIEWLSSQGRAFGVLLMLSLQRPDRDTMDGKLKNNMTVRMAFKMADKINSRIILDSYEAADINMGDSGRMFYKLKGIHEAQALFLEEDDAENILKEYVVEPQDPDVKAIEEEVKESLSEEETPVFKPNIIGEEDE